MKEIVEINYIIIALLVVAIAVWELDDNWNKVKKKNSVKSGSLDESRTT